MSLADRQCACVEQPQGAPCYAGTVHEPLLHSARGPQENGAGQPLHSQHSVCRTLADGIDTLPLSRKDVQHMFDPLLPPLLLAVP